MSFAGIRIKPKKKRKGISDISIPAAGPTRLARSLRLMRRILRYGNITINMERFPGYNRKIEPPEKEEKRGMTRRQFLIALAGEAALAAGGLNL